MRSILILFFCLLGFAFASDLKILQIIPFGTSSVRITFNQDISKLSFKEHSLKDFRSFLDIQAVLVVSRKNYIFSNQTQISIAQNTPEIVRIVIKTNKDSTYRTKIVEKHLYISIVDKLPEPQEIKKPPKREEKKLPVQKKPSQVSHKSNNNQSSSPKKPQASPVRKTQPSAHLNGSKASLHTRAKSSLAPEAPKVSKKYKIVIDPGHGGKDCGAMGVSKICEKVIVLSVSKFLEQELKKRGYIVYMTRDKDVYINLKERTDFANAKNVDLFVSIHANSVPKTSSDSPQGIETYFLSTARSERARKVAELENKDDVDVMNYFSKFSFLNSLNSHRLIASNKLAIDIQFGILRELRKHYQGVVDGGVREGPFWVLAGALMPSVLIEIGYNSNPIEARRIDDKRYQRFLVKGIADGIEGYFAKNY
ncbi:N-acetylmuramoyl-L-alanine amidase [Helicobacter sp. 12S02232-10]|uniref:N-acetylmuramoyl-L-alanine amidase family protein n=1 Tax=Helicobacter sp. 12S02232-10 TaxID=1476197 RepID=UPI000BA5BB85|nr:N-acetylmuramoyl-L-alanine amidase [Helicobacter sp. 12S02232-10]PAF48244.1 N-acetylmuramoyl-L-alanine amidase [Helicobacter sp. 12S02232-10]